MQKKLKKLIRQLVYVFYLICVLNIIPSLAQNAKQDDAERLYQEGVELTIFSDRISEGIESLHKALKLYQQTGNLEKEFEVLDTLFVAFLGGSQDINKALNYAKQKLTVAQKLNEPLLQTRALNSLAAIYAALGDYQKSLETLTQSLSILPDEMSLESNDSEFQEITAEKANIFNSIGLIYIASGNYQKAVEVYTDLNQYQEAISSPYAIPLSPSFGGEKSGKTELGYALYRMGKIAAAEQILSEELANLENGWSIDRILRSFAEQYKQVLINAERAYGINIQREMEQLEQYLHSLEQGYPESMSMNGIDYTSFVDLFNVVGSDDFQATCTYLQQTLIAADKSQKALEISDRCRGRALVERLAGRIGKDEDESLITANVTPLTISQMQQIAKKRNATLINYWVTTENKPFALKKQESEIYIWVIQPTGAITFRRSNLKKLLEQHQLGETANFQDLIAQTRSDLGIKARGETIGNIDMYSDESTKKLQQLHQLLIQPIAELLPKTPEDPVIIIPHESLYTVPFAALQASDGQYLIQKHTISVAPSIQASELTQQRQQQIQQQPQNDALIVGNPTMPLLLPPLPNAEAEANAVASLLGTQAITGDRATESKITSIMPEAKIIHFATHGLLDETNSILTRWTRASSLINFQFTTQMRENPDRQFQAPGSIALAPSEPDRDGLLTSNEISKLKLNADLAVLSACHTGQGNVTTDGVVGLVRAFLTAGVPSLVVSLWAVPDQPTSELMVAFYQNLQQNPNKAQALRKAMLTVMKKHPSPRDWSGFILVGEAN
jgi:CHAT domain-containing protein